MKTESATLEPGVGIDSLPVFARPKPDAIHSCKILIIDDEATNVRLLERVLTRSGFDNFLSTTNPREAAALFIDFEPDLVLTDWLMPDVDGCAVIGQLRELMATDDYLPIVVLTADVTSQAKKAALSAGATDFLTKPFDQIEVVLRVQNLLQARLSHLTIANQNATLEESVRRRTIDLERALTDLQRTQQQVIQQERLAAVGALTSGIAHDFNNAISIIMGFGEVMLHQAEHGLTKEKVTEPLTHILAAAQDAAKIVHRLREFYDPEETTEQPQAVDLNKLVADAILLTRPRWQTEAFAAGRTITIATELGDIHNVAGEGAELREMLTNLIFNAVDAMPTGGKITIGTCTEGDNVNLHITDTGTGMTEEVRQRCLEPFFTTKGKHGTGLGLSMVFGIMQRHQGSIEIASKPGHGTRFDFRLPSFSPEGLERSHAVAQSDVPLRILVVDDQPILSQLVCEYLQEDFHFVETALSGKEAVDKFRSTPFDLVITDHLMSEMTGEEVAVAIKALNPETPLILLTGYAGDAPKERNHSTAIDLVLEKPLSRSALRQSLARLPGLARRQSAGSRASSVVS